MSIRRDLMCQVSLKAHQGICQSKLRSQSQSHEPRNVRSSLPLEFRKTSFEKKDGILSAKKGICMGETYLSTAGRRSAVSAAGNPWRKIHSVAIQNGNRVSSNPGITYAILFVAIKGGGWLGKVTVMKKKFSSRLRSPLWNHVHPPHWLSLSLE